MQSSPASRGSAEPMPLEMLTPRSKVAKMLADIDNASSPPASATSIRTQPTRSGFQRPATGLTKKTNAFLDQSNSESDSATESADDTPRPLGRAARRMHPHHSPRFDRHSQSPSAAPSPASWQGVVSANSGFGESTPRRTAAIRSPSLTPTRSRHGGSDLFVSPAKSTISDRATSPELPNSSSKDRLAALVAQKRAEREAREREEGSHTSSSLHGDDDQGADDDAVDQVLSSSARPNRQASKKAILEMTRETQRMAREQALAHDMKVKKKFTMSDLLARFNQQTPASLVNGISGDTTASSAPGSDITEPQMQEHTSTPPSSPPAADGNEKPRALFNATGDSDDEELMDVHEVVRQSRSSNIKESNPALVQLTDSIQNRVTIADESSDDELEVLQRLPPHLRVFDRIKVSSKNKPDNSCKAIHTLRHLSNVGAQDLAPRRKKNARPTVGRDVLETQLRRKAKAQARQEQLLRIEELKAKGVVVQSAEEREREAEVYENLLEKARQEALDLRQAEKASRKNQQGEDGAVQASEDESEDEDYVGSGSDADAMNESLADDDSGNMLLDDVADDESDGEDSEANEDDEDDMAEQDSHIEVTEDNLQHLKGPALEEEEKDHAATASPVRIRAVRSRFARVIEDEDDDEADDVEADAVAISNVQQHTQLDLGTPMSKTDPFAIFESDAGDSLLMSPTQAFNATMQTPTQFTQTDSLDVYRQNLLPRSNGYAGPSTLKSNSQPLHDGDVDVVPASQTPCSQVPESQQVNLIWDSQPPQTPRPSLARGISNLLETPGWEPTQDGGLPSPGPGLLAHVEIAGSVSEHETQSTVRIRISESPAPTAVPKRGRLVRRQATVEDDDGILEASAGVAVENSEPVSNAFQEMSRRRRMDVTKAEREAARGEMKGMMDDQAEESDDEYAGLGGDDYVAPETEEDKAMIDSSHVDVDERALAAHFAERQRLRDEAETSKLYKDLTTGALRRKQANMFDLDDDEDELAAKRRQMKQQEEARKRRLLLQDDNIADLAEGKQSIKKDAFLKAIADDDEEDDAYDMSDDEPEHGTESQASNPTDSQPTNGVALQEVSGNKRPLHDLYDKAEDRPPAKMRRTQVSSVFRKPASMLEVKESVSFLLDEPDVASFGPSAFDQDDDDHTLNALDAEGDVDDDMDENLESQRANDGGYAPDRLLSSGKIRMSRSVTHGGIVHAAVVDRISLKRSNSNSTDVLNRSAWAMSASGSFKVPSLLRRATTNLGAAANDRGVSTSTASLSRESSSGVKMGGSKKSSLAYQARAEERMAVIEANAKRRQENTARIAQLRRHNTAGGLLGRGLGGQFE